MPITQMNRSFFSKVIMLLGLAISLGGLAAAQDTSANSTQSSSAEKKTPSRKPKKTWTDDDVTALRSPADNYKDAQQAQKAAAAANTTAAAQPAAASEQPHGRPPALSNPKTVDSADKMIAWEDSDLAAQQDFLDRLNTQLESASLDEREALQKKIADRERIIAETRKERDVLVSQKKDLEKKAAGTAASPAAPPHE